MKYFDFDLTDSNLFKMIKNCSRARTVDDVRIECVMFTLNPLQSVEEIAIAS